MDFPLFRFSFMTSRADVINGNGFGLRLPLRCRRFAPASLRVSVFSRGEPKPARFPFRVFPVFSGSSFIHPPSQWLRRDRRVSLSNDWKIDGRAGSARKVGTVRWTVRSSAEHFRRGWFAVRRVRRTSPTKGRSRLKTSASPCPLW